MNVAANRRIPEYISPSALSTYLADPKRYYQMYLCPIKPPREPQTKPMSVGSSFDAFAKSYLHEKIYGKNAADAAKYDLRTIFEAQVEPHNREWAWEAGMYVFGCYKDSGALGDLMFQLDKASAAPRFEIDIRGTVAGYREGITTHKLGVPLLGKPDIFFINGEGAHVILDWKVNGYCAKTAASPKPGYAVCRDAFPAGTSWPNSRGNGQSHADFQPINHLGMEINATHNLEAVDNDWARQLATYGWLLGEPVGAEVLVAIDQICCGPAITGKFPKLRVASHRTRCGESFQFLTIAQYQELWVRVTQEPFHFFREMSLEDSQLLCQSIDESMEYLWNPTTPLSEKEKWLRQISR